MTNDKTKLNKVAEEYLYNHIPVTRHLGVSVTCYDGQSINLAAPLAPNINHQNTAFGGSLVTVAILAGWTLLHLNLTTKKISCRLVIQKSAMFFSKPVLSDFNARCALPEKEWSRFLTMLHTKGIARITLKTDIYDGPVVSGKHTGIFVAILNE